MSATIIQQRIRAGKIFAAEFAKKIDDLIFAELSKPLSVTAIIRQKLLEVSEMNSTTAQSGSVLRTEGESEA